MTSAAMPRASPGCLEEIDEILGVQEEKKPTPKRPAQAAKPAPAKR